MARKKIIPDAKVHAEILRLLAQGGDRAVSFATVAQATGLAGPTLVQRFGSREGMVHTALMAGWAELEDQTAQAEAAAPLTAKGRR
ncbi:TetR family transcriptional regulator [Gemmobacter lanyuensis]